jgi:DNA mismatch endonuclease, patch repair protein
MADIFTKDERSRCMAAIKSRGNKNTELKLITIFRARGIKGWRRHQPLPGRPDFVFTRARVAVFVDGCFWHGCAKHLRMPSSRQNYWQPKIARNMARDAKVTLLLKRRGWKVVRVWEHALKNPDTIALRITKALQRKTAVAKEKVHRH